MPFYCCCCYILPNSFARFFLFIIIFCVKCASETWRAEYYTYLLSDDNRRPNIPRYVRPISQYELHKNVFLLSSCWWFFLLYLYIIKKNTQIVSVCIDACYVVSRYTWLRATLFNNMDF